MSPYEEEEKQTRCNGTGYGRISLSWKYDITFCVYYSSPYAFCLPCLLYSMISYVIREERRKMKYSPSAIIIFYYFVFFPFRVLVFIDERSYILLIWWVVVYNLTQVISKHPKNYIHDIYSSVHFHQFLLDSSATQNANTPYMHAYDFINTFMLA